MYIIGLYPAMFVSYKYSTKDEYKILNQKLNEMIENNKKEIKKLEVKW